MKRDQCVDPNELAALLEGQLDDDAVSGVESHIDTCDDCMELMLALGRAGTSTPDVAGAESPMRIVESGGDTALDDEAPASASHEMLGSGVQIDQYRIVRLLGRGGMGEVYLAHDDELGRDVALKLVHSRLTKSKRARERFRSEARATARFNHPNIVTIHGVGEHDGRPYVALEYIEGDTLRLQVETGDLDIIGTLEIVLAIAEGVAAAHEREVWHRDLKPENVLIDSKGRVRVVDFGLAKMAGGFPVVADGELKRSAQLTVMGGTPLYMAPEQWCGDKVAGAADIWALGVMMFELCTGRHPYLPEEDEERMGYTALRLRNVVCSDAPAPELTAAAAVPEGLFLLVARCMAKDPHERPPADEVVNLIAKLLERMSVDLPPTERPPLTDGAKRRAPGPPTTRRRMQRDTRRTQLVAVAALLVAVGVAARGAFTDSSGGGITSPSAVVSPDLERVSSGSGVSPSAVVRPGESTFLPGSSSTETARPTGSTAPPASSASPPPAASSDARVLLSDPSDPCRKTNECKLHGRCTRRNSQCVVASDADCRALTCAETGRCFKSGNRCVARSAKDCGASRVCKRLGHCTLRGEACQLASDDDCRTSGKCSSLGLCWRGNGGSCEALRDADCRQSARCRSHGACRVEPKNHFCVGGSQADCEKSTRCAAEGFCTYAGGACRVDGDADCRRSAACKTQKRCRYYRNQCVK